MRRAPFGRDVRREANALAQKQRRDRGPSAFALRSGRFLSGSKEPDHCPWRTTSSAAIRKQRVPRSRARNVSNSASTASAINRRAPVAQNFAERIVDCPFLSKGNNSIPGQRRTLLLG